MDNSEQPQLHGDLSTACSDPNPAVMVQCHSAPPPNMSMIKGEVEKFLQGTKRFELPRQTCSVNIIKKTNVFFLIGQYGFSPPPLSPYHCYWKAP
ncbi:Hypothetical predicted protein [Podarcis lilfordi]|uniref:Uncharacterized protein n=1 Tax=Podarcis lilfordi TaxID=74358 RepID=A0AA35K9Q2_9SAUR|nr:Hypothetical predicted protein [Podarcis lilfordi]